MIWDWLLRTLQRLADETGRTGDDMLREWAGLALLDAIDLGYQMGWLDVDEAERRREAVRATIAGLAGGARKNRPDTRESSSRLPRPGAC